MNNLTHTIAAVSTPPGKGGVAIIRISGEGAFDIADKVFSPASEKKLSDFGPRVQIYGYIVDSGERIDDVLLTRFPAPHSYTGEDTVEIACHGGILVSALVLEAVLKAGAMPAAAGEFTRRAFINGRMSLTEAEAISDLLEARSREQIRLSSSTARDALSTKIGDIRTELVSLMSSIYARIDYPDEDLGDFSDKEVLAHLYNIRKKISSLLSTYKTGRAISEGVRTVICGKPNAGKSSLYNLLVGEDAAIVTDIAGTTRDVLERSVPCGKIMLRLTDTAGIREGEKIDEVERIGIERSREMIKKSELLFAIFDLSRPFDEQDRLLCDLIRESKAPKIAILNKSDKPKVFDCDMLPLFDCSITATMQGDGGESLKKIEKAVNELFTDEKILVGEDAVIFSARQNAALSRADEFITAAIESIEAGFSQDAASSDIERALGAVAELDGRAVSEEIVADIFSKFCVGK
ncbi:MAG: tRNA uridine-5-carboxymethylaminomethyl(34) synthesis GTPase MnmE [Ruminococcaceae bacterium]|nr:tRNA uridine-5-carboxymethylaminomethyl(34) synthesis GTPase MnmE [Oscillospiraceae bacterium]